MEVKGSTFRLDEQSLKIIASYKGKNKTKKLETLIYESQSLKIEVKKLKAELKQQNETLANQMSEVVAWVHRQEKLKLEEDKYSIGGNPQKLLLQQFIKQQEELVSELKTVQSKIDRLRNDEHQKGIGYGSRMNGSVPLPKKPIR
jgi:ABC-type phosphate transport system auxiliary subunit